MPIQKEFLTEVEAAKFLSLSVWTLRKWRQVGIGPNFHKFETAVRYSMADLKKYIKANQVRS